MEVQYNNTIKNKNKITEGFHVGSQTPIDDRLIFDNIADLINININTVHRYYEGMVVSVVYTNCQYMWKESLTGELVSSYQYPNNTIVNGVDYSNRYFNFVQLQSIPATSLIYKALISQNSPVATTNTINMVAGQIWNLDQTITDIGTKAKLDTLELISGIIYLIGSKYRSSITQTIYFIVGDNMSYDGTPYVVSTDANGNFAPFINTINAPTEGFFTRYWAGGFDINKIDGFPIGKVVARLSVSDNVLTKNFPIFANGINLSTKDRLIFYSEDGGGGSDDYLKYTEIFIEVYP